MTGAQTPGADQAEAGGRVNGCFFDKPSEAASTNSTSSLARCCAKGGGIMSAMAPLFTPLAAQPELREAESMITTCFEILRSRHLRSSRCASGRPALEA